MKTKKQRIIIGLKQPGLLLEESSILKNANVEFMSPEDIIKWDKKIIYTDNESLIIIVGNSFCEWIARKLATKKRNGMNIELVRYSVHPLGAESKKLFDHHLERTADDHTSLITYLHDKTGIGREHITMYLSNQHAALKELPLAA